MIKHALEDTKWWSVIKNYLIHNVMIDITEMKVLYSIEVTLKDRQHNEFGIIQLGEEAQEAT